MPGERGTFPDRYRAGERKEVWAELVALDARVREEPFFSDAIEVARETMRRARDNVTLIVQRLRDIGYDFHRYGPEAYSSPHQCEVYEPPSQDARELVDQLEKLVGPVPLSVRAFYEEVGSLCLMGTHPSWQPRLDRAYENGIDPTTDPLVFYPIDSTINEIRDLMEFEEGGWARGEIPLRYAPDTLHKANISGGGADEIGLPDPSADVRVQNHLGILSRDLLPI